MTDMTRQSSGKRGGAAVGLMTELAPVEAAAVLYLRLWCNGAAAQGQVRDDFVMLLGPDHGPAAVRSLEQLCDLCVRYGRRPLIRHHVACKCLGGDESCFANFIAAASEGEREDAMWIATMMVRADLAPCLVNLAESLGLALKRMARLATPTTHPNKKTLH